MALWKEDPTQVLTHDHLLKFATDLSKSQGSYGRIAEQLRDMDEVEIMEMNDHLVKLGYKNELMTIIELFEG